MNLERVNSILQIAASVAVLSGAVFVAFEFNQNTEALRVSSVWAEAEAISTLSGSVSTNTDLAAAFANMTSSEPQSLDDLERVRLYFFIRQWMEIVNARYALYTEGLASEDQWTRQRDSMRVFLTINPVIRENFDLLHTQGVLREGLYEELVGSANK